jgi:hypothetical protein
MISYSPRGQPPLFYRPLSTFVGRLSPSGFPYRMGHHHTVTMRQDYDPPVVGLWSATRDATKTSFRGYHQTIRRQPAWWGLRLTVEGVPWAGTCPTPKGGKGGRARVG